MQVEIIHQSTPRPNLKNIESLIQDQLADVNDPFQLEPVKKGTSYKLDKIYDILKAQITFLKEHQMPHKKFCPHCLKVDVPNVNMIKIELSIKKLSKEFQDSWINVLVKKTSWSRIGNTETITKNQNPVFKDFILAEFHFE